MVIGIIEDDRLLNQALKIALNRGGYDTVCAYTKKEALTLFTGGENLFLIDIGLPDGNGISLYRELRRRGNVPAIFLTARDEEEDMLNAYEGGAQDYVVKPFSMKVLMKRIEVVMNRTGSEKEEACISCGDILLYPGRKQVIAEGKEVLLTAKEYQLLEYFMMNQNQVLTKEMILEHVWGLDGNFVVDNTVSVTVNRLRKKIEPDPGNPVYLRNVFGLGYRMENGKDIR